LPVAALILGIVATILSLSVVLFYAAIPVGLVAIVVGVIARKRAMANARPTGAATAGVALGVVGVILGLFLYAACTYVTRRANLEFDRVRRESKAQEQGSQFDDTFQKALQPGAAEGQRRDGGSKK
jgi:hypothetical protein